MRDALGPEELTYLDQRVRRFRKEYGITEYPIDCFQLARELAQSGKMDLEIITSSELSDGFDARAVWFPSAGSYVIFCREPAYNWKKYSATRRCNFTLAHELGHILLGHLAVPDLMKSAAVQRQEEMEADAFAARLLMPEEIFGMFRSIREAADALWVSESAVRRRARETGILPRKLICPRCRFEGMPPGARFCRRCGFKTGEGPNPETPPEAEYLPPLPAECPQCGQPLSGPMNECFNCALPRRNRCTPEYNQPSHYAPGDARYCEICGAPTVYSTALSML